MHTCPYCHTNTQAATCPTCGATVASAPSLVHNDHLPEGFVLHAHNATRFTVGKTLGRGGFGITYIATQQDNTPNTQTVALKECYPEGIVQRRPNGDVAALPQQQQEFDKVLHKFAQEAQLLQRIQHVVATKCFGVFYANNTAYIVMEHILGETLEARVQRGALLNEHEAQIMMHAILELLEELHAQNLVHRDIKPANIMLAAQRTELIDFGSSTTFHSTQPTRITTKILTPQYAPLELYGSHVQLGPPSDLYSLAASAYEGVTGQHAPSAIERMNGNVLTPAHVLNNHISQSFSDVLHKALEPKILDRFANAKAMREALQKIQTKPNSVFQTTPTKMSPWLKALSIFTVATVALALIAVYPKGSKKVDPIWDFTPTTSPTATRFSKPSTINFVKEQCENQSRSDAGFSCVASLSVDAKKNVTLTLEVKPKSKEFIQMTWKQMLESDELNDFSHEFAQQLFLLLNKSFVFVTAKRWGSGMVVTKKLNRTSQPALRKPNDPKPLRFRQARRKMRFVSGYGQELMQAVMAEKMLYLKSSNFLPIGVQEINIRVADNPVTVVSAIQASKKDILDLIQDNTFKFTLQETLQRIHRALPDLVGITCVFLQSSTIRPQIWKLEVRNAKDFERLKNANLGQLDTIWHITRF